MNTTIYSDESGHSGPDLLRPDDPILVVAFVAIPSAIGDVAADQFAELRAANKLQKTAALKFTRLRKSKEGRNFLLRAVEFLDEKHATLYIALVEKRYALAAMIVESFLDPTHNDAAPPQYAPKLRKELANLVLEVADDALLGDLLRSYRNDDKTSFRAAGETLATRMKLHPDDAVRHVGASIEYGLDDFFWFGARPPGTPDRIEKPNPIVHSFLPLLSSIDKHLAASGTRANLVADEDAQFGPVLDLAFQHGKDELHQEFHREFGLSGPLGNVTDYRRASEDEVPAIVYADFLAGIVRHATAARFVGADVDEELLPIWHRAHSCMLRSEGHGYVGLSNRGWDLQLVSK